MICVVWFILLQNNAIICNYESKGHNLYIIYISIILNKRSSPVIDQWHFFIKFMHRWIQWEYFWPDMFLSLFSQYSRWKGTEELFLGGRSLLKQYWLESNLTIIHWCVPSIMVFLSQGLQFIKWWICCIYYNCEDLISLETTVAIPCLLLTIKYSQNFSAIHVRIQLLSYGVVLRQASFTIFFSVIIQILFTTCCTLSQTE